MEIHDALAARIAEDGERLVLRRAAGAGVTLPMPAGFEPWSSAPGAGAGYDHVLCTGLVRGYAARDLTGDVVQGDRQVTISDAEISAAGWPGPPARNDEVLLPDALATVQSVETVRLGGRVAKHVLQIRGA